MLIRDYPPLHLTYCLNIHRGESWAENFAAIREKTLAVRDLVGAEKPFGLGLRLSAQAARELSDLDALKAARDFFDANNLYAFTINGFPYGRFHAGPVKENVYQPDWRTPERRDYTVALARILAGLLPDGIQGSISTVPCSYKAWIKTPADVDLMVTHLAECAKALHEIRETTGKEIHLGLEPEPDCFLETTGETIRFFRETLFRDGFKKLRAMKMDDPNILPRHIGVCFDTCHSAMQFEDLAQSLREYRKTGIRISKIQVSAALRASCDAESLRALEPFCEPVYLHQVKARDANGLQIKWNDLPDALRNMPPGMGEMRVHFHVPLFVEQYGALGSTVDSLTSSFHSELQKCGTSHIELETYTFDVLPEELRSAGVVQSIASEYRWFLDQMSKNQEAPPDKRRLGAG